MSRKGTDEPLNVYYDNINTIMLCQADREHVKEQLRQQQQTWDDRQSTGSCSTSGKLQIWSIGKLLRVVKASISAENPHATLAHNGIIRYPVGCVNQHRVAFQSPAMLDVVTYTSSHVWVTGFIHFGEEVDNCDILYLCDSHSKLPSYLLDPSPFLVDRLVLVKHWVLVDKAFGGVCTAGSMFLEIHDREPVPLLPMHEMYEDWTQEDVRRVLKASYESMDPPMYSSTERWATIAALWRGSAAHQDTAQCTATIGEVTTARQKKRQKPVYAVYGRITSVSSISRQKDRVSSHFFVEVEDLQRCSESETQSAVNVMFTGVYSMRWHLFLRPGKTVLLTDLVRVLSRECDMFLLQATHAHPPHHNLEPMKGTTVLLWDPPAFSRDIKLKWIDESLKTCSMDHALRCTGKLLDYEGKVIRLLWDECIELEGSSGTRIIVSLFHFPFEEELIRLRKGGSVRVCGAHVVRWPTPAGGKLVIGLCPRSHFAVVAYADPSSPCIFTGTRSCRSRTNGKWSYFGDVHTQSMVLSMWLLELLEVVDKQFFFGEVEQVRFQSSALSFPRTRRRRAVAQVAKTLCLLPSEPRNPAAMTLSALFLKCHSANAENCIALSLPHRESILTWSKALTIRELQAFAESVSDHTTAAVSDVVGKHGEHRSMRISAKDLSWCLLLAGIRGSVDDGDLEVYDRTGSISMILDCSEKGMDFVSGRGVYLMRNFDITIDVYNRLGDDQFPVVLCIRCSVADVVFVEINDDEPVGLHREVSTARDEAHKLQEALFFVSHIDALPRSSIRSSELLPEYRLFHGIVCPIGESLQPDCFMRSLCTANILVSSQSSHWYLQKGGCYRVRALEVRKSGGQRVSSHHGIEDLAVEASINYWEKVVVADNDKLLCFDSLRRFRCQSIGTPMNRERLFRVYQVGAHPIVPVRLECIECARCKVHDLCQQADVDDSGFIVAGVNNGSHDAIVSRTAKAQHLVRRMPIKATASQVMAMSIFRYFLEQSEEVVSVSSLLQQPLSCGLQQSIGNGNSVEEQPVATTLDPSLHKPHLVSVKGMITKKRYYWRSNGQHQPLASTGPSSLECVWHCHRSVAQGSSGRWICVLSVRDLQHLDSVEVRADTSLFGLLGTLQLGNVVEISRLHGFTARASYKVHLKWSHSTAARRLLSESDCLLVPCDAELFGSLRTTFLNGLYNASTIDQMLHRYVVGVMHMSYMVLKRKCSLCHQTLQLDKRRGCWKHEESRVESQSLLACAWRWQQLAPSDDAIRARTYVGTTVRCIIDDGSGQAELFLEDDVAWELLECSDGQRRRFEDVVRNYVSQLSYFSGRSATASFATSKAEREQEYYQNELRAFVLDAMPSLRSIVVFARQFFSAKPKTNTSVLTFGKDVHITTWTMALPKLEARRVDRVHVRDELKRRLAQLQEELGD